MGFPQHSIFADTGGVAKNIETRPIHALANISGGTCSIRQGLSITTEMRHQHQVSLK